MDPSTDAVRSAGEPAPGFSALGDPARLAILETLCDGGRCVCELVPELGMGQTLLSYHLRILREAGLVSGTRRGRRIEYTIRTTSLEALMKNLGRLAGEGA